MSYDHTGCRSQDEIVYMVARIPGLDERVKDCVLSGCDMSERGVRRNDGIDSPCMEWSLS